MEWLHKTRKMSYIILEIKTSPGGLRKCSITNVEIEKAATITGLAYKSMSGKCSKLTLTKPSQMCRKYLTLVPTYKYEVHLCLPNT